MKRIRCPLGVRAFPSDLIAFAIQRAPSAVTACTNLHRSSASGSRNGSGALPVDAHGMGGNDAIAVNAKPCGSSLERMSDERCAACPRDVCGKDAMLGTPDTKGCIFEIGCH